MPRIAAPTLLALVVMLTGGCIGSAATPNPPATTQSPASTSAAPTGSGSPADASSGSNDAVPDSPVAGIVVAVDGSGSQVKGFTLRTNDGTTINFVIGQLENSDEFPPDQLADRQTSAAPILVFFRPVNGQLVAYRLEDAG